MNWKYEHVNIKSPLKPKDYQRVFRLYQLCESKNNQYSRLHDSIWYPNNDEKKERKRNYHALRTKYYHRKMFFEFVLSGRVCLVKEAVA